MEMIACMGKKHHTVWDNIIQKGENQHGMSLLQTGNGTGIYPMPGWHYMDTEKTAGKGIVFFGKGGS